MIGDLKHIDDVSPVSELDKEIFREVAEVLRKHGALQRFGITLLHKHFEVSEEEILLERTDAMQRVQTVEPVRKAHLDESHTIETSWRLDRNPPVAISACINFPHQGHVNVPRPSDVQLKQDILPLESALATVCRLDPVEFSYTDEQLGLPSGRQVGFIAQDVEEIMPTLVRDGRLKSRNAGPMPDGQLGEYKHVDYVGLVPVLVGALKEQQQLIRELYDHLKLTLPKS